MTKAELEHWIETTAERMTDRIDRRYMDAHLTEKEYALEMLKVKQWARKQYQNAKPLEAK